MSKKWEKSLPLLEIFAIIISFVFFLYLTAVTMLFTQHPVFYAMLLLVVYVAVIMWWIGSKKKLPSLILGGKIILSVCLLVAAISYACYWKNSQIKVMGDTLNLELYQPFREGSKIARLDHPASLRLNSDLPWLDGATALYPLYSAFVEAVYPEGKEDYSLQAGLVACSRTNEAYDKLLKGMADIIFCAAPSAEQREAAKALGLDYEMTPIAKGAFVFFVNPKNPIDEITSEQIREIYSGKVTNWKQIGWGNYDIKAFQRPEGSGSQTMLQNIMGNVPIQEPVMTNRIGGMEEIIRETADYKNFKSAIGFSFLFFASEMLQNKQIKLLAVDGVFPSRETIQNNSYPFISDIFAVTVRERSENMQQLIDWILSDEGQELVEKTGYTPLR